MARTLPPFEDNGRSVDAALEDKRKREQQEREARIAESEAKLRAATDALAARIAAGEVIPGVNG